MSVNLSGYVTDDKGNGRNKVRVVVINASTGVVAATTYTTNDGTGKAGYWTFTGLSDGSYYVRVYSNNVNIVRGDTAAQHSQLQVKDRFRLPTAAFASPSAGDTYFDTATNRLYVHNGTGWVSVLLA